MFVMPELDRVLSYKHPQVIVNYQRNYPQNEAIAGYLFHEMLKFLWLSRKHALDLENHRGNPTIDFLFVMHEEMRDIDNMWHTFILYTKDYIDFCNQHFGEYLHHQPDVADTSPQSPEEFKRDLEKFLSYTYDHLGEETVRGWFAMHLEERSDEAIPL